MSRLETWRTCDARTFVELRKRSKKSKTGGKKKGSLVESLTNEVQQARTQLEAVVEESKHQIDEAVKVKVATVQTMQSVKSAQAAE